MLIVGIDPGSGKSSPTGFAIIERSSKTIVHTLTLGDVDGCTDFSHRIKRIADDLRQLLILVPIDEEVLIFIESFVMRGKGGEQLARLTGAIMAAVPYKHRIIFVHNTTMKKAIGGNGKADKKQVAEGVRRWFRGNTESVAYVDRLIEKELWDILDAMGLALCGWQRIQSSEAAVAECTCKG